MGPFFKIPFFLGYSLFPKKTFGRFLPNSLNQLRQILYYSQKGGKKALKRLVLKLFSNYSSYWGRYELGIYRKKFLP